MENVRYDYLEKIKSYYCIVDGVTVICINEDLSEHERNEQYDICCEALKQNDGKKHIEVFM